MPKGLLARILLIVSLLLLSSKPQAESYYINQGETAPFTGVLLHSKEMAEIIAYNKFLKRQQDNLKQVYQTQIQAVQRSNKELCELYKQRNTPPWWLLLAIGIGALGVGIGIGVYVH